MICNNLIEKALEFKILFHEKVAIQQISTYELMKQGGLVLKYHSYLDYGHSIEFIANRD
jgi:hypothetical protein